MSTSCRWEEVSDLRLGGMLKVPESKMIIINHGLWRWAKNLKWADREGSFVWKPSCFQYWKNLGLLWSGYDQCNNRRLESHCYQLGLWCGRQISRILATYKCCCSLEVGDWIEIWFTYQAPGGVRYIENAEWGWYSFFKINLGITAALRVCHMDRGRYSIAYYNIIASKDKNRR